LAEVPVDRMDQIVRTYSDNHQFMGSVLVAQGDKVVFEKSYGDANLEWKVPDDSLTKFRIGSMTKQFTAASILLLEERGKLSTDDYVKKYLPDAPAAWDKITIYNLLTHTSGIPSLSANDGIDCSVLISKFRCRTKIALLIATLDPNLLANQ
jgi:CubicO group peptidase (beta-lactamase class C family)